VARDASGNPKSTPEGKPVFARRELGLGTVAQSSMGAAGESLREARDSAAKARALIREGIDPIEHRDAKRREASQEAESAAARRKANHTTLRRYCRSYHEAHVEPILTTKHAAQWISSIEGPKGKQRPERVLLNALLDRPIASVEPLELLDALTQLSRVIPETGSRVYQRIAEVYREAILEGLCTSSPADPIRKKLAQRVGPRKRGNFAAMDWKRVPEFMQRLRAAEGTAPRCLELAILTAARTSEVLECQWSEFDTENRAWTVPAARMKRKNEGDHVVFLSDRALEIIEGQRGRHETFVFPSVTGSGKPQSNMALTMCLRRLGEGDATVHGFRSAFSTWAAETDAAVPDVVEAALAHKEKDRVRRAYMRGQFLEQRRQLAQKWAHFCNKGQYVSNIIPLQKVA
jgi:integrase